MEKDKTEDTRRKIDVDEITMLAEVVAETATTLAKLAGKDNIAESVTVTTNFRKSLSHESDRGAALMAAAYIDDRLAELLKKYLIKDRKKLIDGLFNFNGALGTFSSRAGMAYCLGLIPENIFNDINTLRNIRNSFAHDSSHITFESEAIKSKCHSFESHLLKDKSAKSKFNRTMMSIISVVDPLLRDDISECIKMDNYDLAEHKAAIDIFKEFATKNGFDASEIQ